MSGLSTLGGLIAVIGGLFILVQTFINWGDLWGVASVALIINLAVGGCGLIGGVFGMKGQRGAGGLALVVGILSIVIGLIFVYAAHTDYSLWQFSLFSETMLLFSPLANIAGTGISLEAILITVGGLLVIAGGGED